VGHIPAYLVRPVHESYTVVSTDDSLAGSMESGTSLGYDRGKEKWQ